VQYYRYGTTSIVLNMNTVLLVLKDSIYTLKKEHSKSHNNTYSIVPGSTVIF